MSSKLEHIRLANSVTILLNPTFPTFHTFLAGVQVCIDCYLAAGLLVYSKNLQLGQLPVAGKKIDRQQIGRLDSLVTDQRQRWGLSRNGEPSPNATEQGSATFEEAAVNLIELEKRSIEVLQSWYGFVPLTPVDEGINPLVDEMPSFSRHTARRQTLDPCKALDWAIKQHSEAIQSFRRYCLPDQKDRKSVKHRHRFSW